MADAPDAFWGHTAEQQLAELGVTGDGLTSQEAARRLATFGPNRLRVQRERGDIALLLSQFRSPIILILIAAAVLSAFLGDAVDAGIIIAIVLVSGVLTFWQERGAADAVKKLLAVVEIKAQVLRDGREVALPHDDVVPGDVVVLSAGATIPADCLILESTDLYVDEASLTGESFPVEKAVGALAEDTPLAKRTNAVFMGTHVVSGAAHVLVVKTASATEFGAVSDRLAQAQPETDFEHGVRRFGYLLMEVTLMLVIAIFAINVLLHKPAIDSFLFSLALAVGLTPQLLPAIISINLAHGARRMAERRVIVKRLDSIEDFGSMDVLCSDKTGTLTEGVVTVSGGFDVRGGDSEDVMLYAYLNSCLETGFTNPIDVAVRASRTFDLSRIVKLDEVPYDFERKRLTILVERGGKPLMVTKGAFANVLAVCTQARMPSGSTVRIDEVRSDVEKLYRDLSAKGLRTLGVAVREDTAREIDATAETGMTFVGVLALFDPPKEGATAAVEELRTLGVRLKIITGDNTLVARTAGASMGLDEPVVMTGSELHGMHERALVRRVDAIDIFAEIEPNQKEYLVRLLQKAGHVIGYMGDGINDASALHVADVGISVNSAVDVAKEAADIVLLEPGLDVLAQGVRDGRATFANTLKYVFMATSANFGNMFSMAGASLFLPFLPLLPTQILLTNLLTDFPEMTIASDNVDPELVERPRRWDIRFIRRFMIVFGLLSSVFDYATFAALLWVMKLPVWGAPGAATTYAQALFRTGWFTESVLSASMVVLVIRTRRPVFRSRPGRLLAIATVSIWIVTLGIPYTPLGALFRFVPLTWPFLLMLAIILALYMSGAEVAKYLFYRSEDASHPNAGSRPVAADKRPARPRL
jgi:Mg2+-importing ATPase